MSDTDAPSGGFEKLEPANLVILGDRKGQTKKFGGLLVDMVADDQYPDKTRYVCVGTDGKEYEIAGNAALSKRIKHAHIGCLVKFLFQGRVRGQGGNTYKEIEVLAQPRELTTDKQKKMFPRWHDFEKPEKQANDDGAEDGFDQM